MLEVITPGLLSTVQDAGRLDYTDLGVPRAGACDPWALAAANLLLGNPPGAAALEITIAGPALRARQTGVVALAGADLGAWIAPEDRALAPGGAYLLRAGATLAFRGGPRGARAYLALPGGIVVPRVLGAAATYLAGGFGGLDGRPLRPGDYLPAAHPADWRAAGQLWPATIPDPYVDPPCVRVLPGPHAAHFAPAALATLLAVPWEVGPQSDRMGLRLQGPALPFAPGRADLVSQGVVWGALQVPPDGQPIALLADHQTVGGYPILAVAITADRPRLAQLPPGARLRFTLTTLAEAQAAVRAQQAALHTAAAQLAAPALWDRLADQMGG
ncbi:MAG TPA: biotin-dependent carboxyltransferase family protein [Chloroflexia bacterium]|nr:biotin-dependent carboxyltransferase family protein [Chloroflexia bacterium]